MSLNLKKVALVTGAGSGIGAAIAVKFAEQGIRIAIIGRDEKKLNNTVKKCEQYGCKPLALATDISKDENAKKLVNDTINHFGKLDILVNNAATGGAKSNILDENAMELFDRVVSTNLRAAVYITNLAAPHLVQTKGNIINISSVAALRPLSVNFPYCTSKAALDHFTRCIAFELGPKGVRANCVTPGPVKTDIFKHLGPSFADHLDERYESMKLTTVLGKLTEPEEIADLVYYLASDKGKSITGATFVVDNGSNVKGMR